jgi:hypothetical protein
MCYVYQTQRFIESVDRVQIRGDIASLIVKLEEMTISDAKSMFVNHNPYIKRRIEKNRVIAKFKMCLNGETVLCMLDILERDGEDYKYFIKDARKYGDRYFEHLIDDTKLIPWLDTQRKEPKNVEVNRLEIPDALRFWLDPPEYISLEASNETIIFESGTWVKLFQDSDIRDYWQSYYDIIFKLVENKIDELQIFEFQSIFKVGRIKERGVLFAKSTIMKPYIKDIIFLVAPLKMKDSDNDIRAYIDEYQHVKFFSESEPNADDIARLSSRAYPSYVLYDETIW